MRKLIVHSSLFLLGFLFLSLAQATNFDDIEVCPNVPNQNNNNNTIINPIAPGKKPANEVLKVGDTCKVPTVETRTGKNEGYKLMGHAQWTLVKKDGGKEIWAAHTLWILSEDGGKEDWVAHALRGGPIYVGYVEPSYYHFSKAKWVCGKYIEIELDGNSHRIQMTLPEIGFGHTDIDNPLNFEFLRYLNYTSVTPDPDLDEILSTRFSAITDEDRSWFWSRSTYGRLDAWTFNSISGEYDHFSRGYRNAYDLVRCVGR